MTVKQLIEWLQANVPQDAEVVTTNSQAWFSNEVKEVPSWEIGDFFFLKMNPTKNHKPVDKPCLVIRDERRSDY